MAQNIHSKLNKLPCAKSLIQSNEPYEWSQMVIVVVVIIAIFIPILFHFADNSNYGHKVRRSIEDEPLAPLPIPFYKKMKIGLRLNRVRVRVRVT